MRRGLIIKSLYFLWPLLLTAPLSMGMALVSKMGQIVPHVVPIVREGMELQMNCTGNSMGIPTLQWAEDVDMDQLSTSMFWQRDSLVLHPENDPRVSVKILDQWTVGLWISNSTVRDSGGYKCLIRNGSDDNFGTMVDTATVIVAGGPVKYKDFRCESENYKNLVCTWKRGDSYPNEHDRDARTKYTVHWRLINEYEDVAHPLNITNVKGDLYRAEWNTTTVRPFMIEYKHVITITGTNVFGKESWIEAVKPSEQIRPNPPTDLNVTVRESTTLGLTWKVTTNLEGHVLREYGFDFEIGYRVSGESDDDWKTVTETGFSHDLKDLFADTLYDIRVRSVVRASGFWSDYANISKKTEPTPPRDDPKPVPGAYEELGASRMDRKVLLYWQGIPYRLRNGPDFHYKVYTIDGDNVEACQSGQKSISEKFIKQAYFANIQLTIPANKSVTVKIEPVNKEGVGEKSGCTLIPAVHDQSVLVNATNVVHYSDSIYEISWDTSKAVDGIDIFWCHTSLLPHLAKCTDQMGYRAVFGNSTENRMKAVNITVSDPKQYYRFAIAARVGDNYSGMNWVPEMCDVKDKQPRLGGLLVHPLLNASMEIVWTAPCQSRFMPISGYHVFNYVCPLDSHNECQNARLLAEQDLSRNIENGTRKLFTGLEPETRYCFVVRVHVESDTYNLDDPVSDSEQCAVTLPLVPVAPVGSIIGGAICGAILLVVLIILVWTGVRRLRKDLTQIQKESCKIIIPPIHADKYDDDADLGYTKINCDDKNRDYLRQMSDRSGSSGLGSTVSEYDGRGVPVFGADNPQIKRRSDSFGNKKHSVGSHIVGSSMIDLNNVRTQLEAIKDKGDTSSIASCGSEPSLYRKALKAKRLGSVEIKTETIASRRVSAGLSGSSSGGTSLTDCPDTSFGYVPASSFQPGSSNQSGANTGDMGYVSHPSESSDNHDLSGISRRSNSSGFSETNSPGSGKKIEYLKPLLNLKSSYESDVESVELQRIRRGSEEDLLSSASSGQESPAASHTPLNPMKFQRDEASGYVKWP